MSPQQSEARVVSMELSGHCHLSVTEARLPPAGGRGGLSGVVVVGRSHEAVGLLLAYGMVKHSHESNTQ